MWMTERNANGKKGKAWKKWIFNVNKIVHKNKLISTNWAKNPVEFPYEEELLLQRDAISQRNRVCRHFSSTICMWNIYMIILISVSFLSFRSMINLQKFPSFSIDRRFEHIPESFSVILKMKIHKKFFFFYYNFCVFCWINHCTKFNQNCCFPFVLMEIMCFVTIRN